MRRAFKDNFVEYDSSEMKGKYRPRQGNIPTSLSMVCATIGVVGFVQNHRSAPLDPSGPKPCLYLLSLETILLHYRYLNREYFYLAYYSLANFRMAYQSMESRIRRIRNVIYHNQRITLSSIVMLKLRLSLANRGAPHMITRQTAEHYQAILLAIRPTSQTQRSAFPLMQQFHAYSCQWRLYQPNTIADGTNQY